MSKTYTKTKEPPIDVPRLRAEIEADGAITKVLEGVTWNEPDELLCTFAENLSMDEELALNAVIAAHDGEPLPTWTVYCFSCGKVSVVWSLTEPTKCPLCDSENIEILSDAPPVPLVRLTKSAQHLPDTPKDGDTHFHPTYRLRFYWDTTREKWLTDFVFEMVFTKSGSLGVGEYLELYGAPNLGARLPLFATIVTLTVVCSTVGAGDDFTLALERNGVEVATFDASGYSTFNLTANEDMLPVAADEEGYRFKLKSSTGTPPQDVVVNVSYRIKL